jgi:hypothetical protein
VPIYPAFPIGCQELVRLLHFAGKVNSVSPAIAPLCFVSDRDRAAAQYVAKGGHKPTWLCGYDVGPITSYTAISRTGVGLRATGELASRTWRAASCPWQATARLPLMRARSACRSCPSVADQTIFESWFGSIDWFPGLRGDRAINRQSNLTGRASVANAGFADTTRAALHVLDLHVLDKGTQFRQRLASARIVEEEPRRCDGKRRE